MGRLSLLLTVPAMVILVLFAVANRAVTAIDFWPTGIALEMPVYLVALLPLLLGLLLGALPIWLRLILWRARARRRERQIAGLEAEIADLRAKAVARAAEPLAVAVAPVAQPAPTLVTVQD